MSFIQGDHFVLFFGRKIACIIALSYCCVCFQGMAVIQGGQSVLVESEQAQQFRFKEKHIDWLRRIKNADEPCPFVMLARNTYLHRKYKQLKPDDIQVSAVSVREAHT